MELKGLAKQGRVVAVAMASCGMVLGMTAPIAAAQPTIGDTWEMPALREELLQDAVDSVFEAAGEENVVLGLYDRSLNQVVYNYTNWIVCGQAPKAGDVIEVTEKPRTITMALERPSAGC